MNESIEVNSKWDIREYRDGDEDQILELRGVVTGDSRDIWWWRWMYRNGPDGPAFFRLANNKRKIVGINPCLPLRMKIGEQVFKSVLGFDIMTHPDYQHRGVLSSLAPFGAEYRLNNGISIDYGCSTPQRYPVYQKLKYPQNIFAICQPALLVKVINWAKVLKARYKIPVFMGKLLGYALELMSRHTPPLNTNDIEIKQISSFDESIDTFWRKASEIKPIMLVKDMKYLNWRYAEKPGNEYVIFMAKKHEETAGYIVVKKTDNKTVTRGAIVDLLTLPRSDDIAKALITRAIEYLRNEGVSIISCLMLPDTPYYSIFQKMGFMRRHSGIQLNSRVFDLKLSREFIGNPSNWYFVWGDIDTI